MRAWGLAKGLQAQGIDVTVAVNNSFPQELSEHEGVRLTNWGQDQQFADLLNSYDAVVISYCMGSDSVFVADNINDHVLLILDVYVPIYVEVSARESKEMDTEYRNYMADIQRFNHVLRRGDYFLCAHPAQKIYYTGVLSGLGIINPRSYRENRILVVPFGIHDIPASPAKNPYLDLGIKKSDFVVLWFGGLYPWFRVEELLAAIKRLSGLKNFKFVIVGGKNPFNPNPDFFRQYEAAQKFAKQESLLERSFFFVDWVDFEDRINWYAHANVVVSINQPGEENGLSWRTRVMDYVWGELAIVTNGGDPLSEDLLAASAAIRLDNLAADTIADTITNLYHNPERLKQVKQNIIDLKPRYHWHQIVMPITEAIYNLRHPYVEELTYRKKLHIGEPETMPTAVGSRHVRRMRKALALPPRAISYARRKGLRRSVKLAASIARTQAGSRLRKREKKFVFISHPIDNTGAPQVLLQIIDEFVQKYGAKRVQLIAPHILPHQLRRLREAGVRVDKAALGLGYRLLKLQLDIRKDDFVLINTVAVYENYWHFVLKALDSGQLDKAYWFIHEDKAQLANVNRDFLQKRNLKQIQQLVRKKKLQILVPSQRVRQDYNQILQTKTVKAIPLHVDIDEKYKRPRPAQDYEEMHFLLSGTPSDGRKGQFIAISAFYSFIKNYYEKAPEKYRNFTLHLVSIGEDYVSQQIRWAGESLLKGHVEIYPSLPFEEVLEVTRRCNAVICCSLNETFGLYVAEGMFMGHIVLRNDSAGIDEQLKEGVNGYFIDSTKVDQFAKAIEKLLNKQTASDKALQKMGQASQKIIAPYAHHTYLDIIEQHPS